MIALIFDRRIFNYIIMTLYVMSAIRWGFAGSWKDVSYWVFACGITATVTFGYDH